LPARSIQDAQPILSREDEARRLFTQIERILARAIAEQGTSVRTYRVLTGEAGNFQNFLRVYDRAKVESRTETKVIILHPGETTTI
jgi:formamidopyrimidine-DNA glycosylase